MQRLAYYLVVINEVQSYPYVISTRGNNNEMEGKTRVEEERHTKGEIVIRNRPGMTYHEGIYIHLTSRQISTHLGHLILLLILDAEYNFLNTAY